MVGNQDVWVEEVDRKLEGNREGRVGMVDRGREKGPGVYNPGSRKVKLEGKGKFQVCRCFRLPQWI